MRLLIAMMKHETNTFSPVPTPLARFGPLHGDAIRALRQVILLDERVRNTAVDLARMSQEVADLRDRVSRLEGMLAAGMARSREANPSRDRHRLTGPSDRTS